MSLPNLPTELQDLIITNLHPAAAIALSQTNRYYHYTVSLHRLDFDTIRIFLEDLLQRPDNSFLRGRTKYRFACYKCLYIKPATPSEDPEGKAYDAGCQYLKCDLQDGRVKPDGIYFSSCFSLWGSRSSIVCIKCLKAQEIFCKGCDACNPCLEKKGIEFCVNCGWCYACVRLKSVEWLGQIIGLAREAEGKCCRGYGACAPCLGRKGVEFCGDCGWCDICVRHKSEKNEEPFWIQKPCERHVPEYGKAINMERAREEGQDTTEDESEESEPFQEDDDEHEACSLG